VHAPPITSTTLADGTCVKHKRPLKPYLLDVTCAALGGKAHTLTVYASGSTAFPLIIGTPGMSQLGVQITCDDPSVSPHVAIGRELIAPTPDLTTAAATEAAATRHQHSLRLTHCWTGRTRCCSCSTTLSIYIQLFK
jgi:hypothetical protein